MVKKVLLATGLPELDLAISKIQGYDYIKSSISYKKDLMDATYSFKPDILVVTERLSGTELLTGILVSVKQAYPKVRIIYLAGEVNMSDVNKVSKLGAMVMAGIYDIITDRVVNRGVIENALSFEKSFSDVEYLLKYFADKKRDSGASFMYEDEEALEEEDVDYYENVYMISSVKPGTGKTFIAVNLATAVAEFGRTKKGTKPKVALIEADLQTLSVGTVLAIEDSKNNLKTVLDKIAKIVSAEDGKVSKDEGKVRETDEYILNTFKPYAKCSNLYALVGSEIALDELKNVSPFYYTYLLNVVAKNFDVVIIDSNSSLYHVTTAPLVLSSKWCYYVMNLDYNNVKNNQRYIETIKGNGFYEKVRYILNEDLTGVKSCGERLEFDSNVLEESFKLEAKVPMIDKIIAMNRMWQATPIVLDNTDYTLKARYEISKVANQICDIDNLSWLEKEVSRLENSGKRSWFSRKK